MSNLPTQGFKKTFAWMTAVQAEQKKAHGMPTGEVPSQPYQGCGGVPLGWIQSISISQQNEAQGMPIEIKASPGHASSIGAIPAHVKEAGREGAKAMASRRYMGHVSSYQDGRGHSIGFRV